jgi:methyl-accepting chemotaxis protein
VNNIVKNSRNRSEDPVQESLREHKAHWNTDASLLIAQLIAFKKGLNGRGESRVGLPPSTIKNPIPNEIVAYLNQLAERYNSLINDAHSIIDEQKQYSDHRQKSKKELGTTSAIEYGLIKEASWWGSRAWTYAKNQYLNPKYWTTDNKDVKNRMNMLKAASYLVEHLKNVDDFLVRKEENSVANAVYEFNRYFYAFDKLLMLNMGELVARHIEKVLLDKSPDGISEKNEEPIIQPKEDSVLEKSKEEPFVELSGDKKDYLHEISAQDILNDLVYTGRIVQIFGLLGVSKEDILFFQNEIKELRFNVDNYNLTSTNDNLDDLKKESFNKKYKKLLDFCSKILNINGNSFSELLEKAEKLIISKANDISNELEKLSHNMLTRWLKRQKLKLFPNSIDKLILNTSENIIKLQETIDNLQNILENNNSSILNISQAISEVAGESANLTNLLSVIAKNHNAEYEEERLRGKPQIKLINETNVNRLDKAQRFFQSVQTEMKSKEELLK